jgi:hypothetical protein
VPRETGNPGRGGRGDTKEIHEDAVLFDRVLISKDADNTALF